MCQCIFDLYGKENKIKWNAVRWYRIIDLEELSSPCWLTFKGIKKLFVKCSQIHQMSIWNMSVYVYLIYMKMKTRLNAVRWYRIIDVGKAYFITNIENGLHFFIMCWFTKRWYFRIWDKQGGRTRKQILKVTFGTMHLNCGRWLCVTTHEILSREEHEMELRHRTRPSADISIFGSQSASTAGGWGDMRQFPTDTMSDDIFLPFESLLPPDGESVSRAFGKWHQL